VKAVDPYIIIFAALAVVILLCLYAVLGQRTGSKRPFRGGAFNYRHSLVAAGIAVVLYIAYEAYAARVTPITIYGGSGTTISGPARVIDGDTVVVANTTVRLKGVDAAELGTPRGDDARRVMAALVTGRLHCRLTGEKTYGREVGYCTTADGTDINRAIIARGAALACPRYDARYVPFEQAEALAAQHRSSYCVKH
jgi:hypothetical protein